jgi:hypothetical protein
MYNFNYTQDYPKIDDMVGKTFTSVVSTGDEMIFSNDEEQYVFYHSQDCCEHVSIEDICGDLSDLEDTPILMAEQVDSDSMTTYRILRDEYDESFTYTFYKFATIKGYVDVRWYGSSNGYYSEEVYLKRIKKDVGSV